MANTGDKYNAFLFVFVIENGSLSFMWTRIPYFIEDVYPPEEYERLLVKKGSRECMVSQNLKCLA